MTESERRTMEHDRAMETQRRVKAERVQCETPRHHYAEGASRCDCGTFGRPLEVEMSAHRTWKQTALAMGEYRCPAPPASTAGWSDAEWIAWVDAEGEWHREPYSGGVPDDCAGGREPRPEHQPHPGPSVPDWWTLADRHEVPVAEDDVALTPRREAAAGQVWRVKVSGRVVTVRITRVGHRPSFGSRSGRSVQRPWFWGVNVKTGRDISGNRMRLRSRVS